MMTSLPTGSVTSIFLRLCVRAPRTTRAAASPTVVSTVHFPGECLNSNRSAAGARRATEGGPSALRNFCEEREEALGFVVGQRAEQFALSLFEDRGTAQVRGAASVGEHRE